MGRDDHKGKLFCGECSGTGFKFSQYSFNAVQRGAIVGTDICSVRLTPCRKCKGTGWYSPEEIVPVPVKSVKDEYWK
jgi:DnaJ-class molecular chaperone